jgi:hypothetical protein
LRLRIAADPAQCTRIGAHRQLSNRPILIEDDAVDFHRCDRPEFNCRRIEEKELPFTLRLRMDEFILVDFVAADHPFPSLVAGRPARNVALDEPSLADGESVGVGCAGGCSDDDGQSGERADSIHLISLPSCLLTLDEFIAIFP